MASASTIVDLPEPFSPTRKVTPASTSSPRSSRLATAGMRAHHWDRSAGRSGSSSTRRSGRRSSSRRRPVLGRLLLVIVAARQPGGEAFDRRLVVGIGVEEIAQPFGHPLDADHLVAAALDQLLDTPVREVHRRPPPLLRWVQAGVPYLRENANRGPLLAHGSVKRAEAARRRGSRPVGPRAP